MKVKFVVSERGISYLLLNYYCASGFLPAIQLILCGQQVPLTRLSHWSTESDFTRSPIRARSWVLFFMGLREATLTGTLTVPYFGAFNLHHFLTHQALPNILLIWVPVRASRQLIS